MKSDLQLFNSIAQALLVAEQSTPVTPYIAADDIYDHVDLELKDEPLSEVDFEASITDLIIKTPKTATDHFFNQLFGGRQGKAVVGELLAVLLNNSMYTYKVGGPMIAVEKTIIKHICKSIGFPESSDGTIATGGSMTNFMGMLMARDHKDPNVKTKGNTGKLTVYCSAASHYSNAKNAAFAGIGRDNVRYIKTDATGRMLADELRAQVQADIAAGMKPCCVIATSGTTVLGAFDPINPLADICDEFKIWLHVDAAFGGSVLWSDKYKYLLDGRERADSFSVNAHKMLGTPITCSIIVTKHREMLYESFSNKASYLYQTEGDDLNLGKISLQCGRRNDALKFWTLWKAVGHQGLKNIVEHQFDLADYAREYIDTNPDYTNYGTAPSICICFNYKGISPEEICNKLYQAGELMVGYGSFGGDTFVRFVTINATNTKDDIDNFFARFEAFAKANF